MSVEELLARANEVRDRTRDEVAAAESRARAAVRELDEALAEGATAYRWDGERPAPRKRAPSYWATHHPLGWRDQVGTSQDLRLRVCHDMGYTTTRTATRSRQAPRQSVTGEVDGVRYRNGICVELATWKVERHASGRYGSGTTYVCDAHLDDEHNPHKHNAARTTPLSAA